MSDSGGGEKPAIEEVDNAGADGAGTGSKHIGFSGEEPSYAKEKEQQGRGGQVFDEGFKEYVKKRKSTSTMLVGVTIVLSIVYGAMTMANFGPMWGDFLFYGIAGALCLIAGLVLMIATVSQSAGMISAVKWIYVFAMLVYLGFDVAWLVASSPGDARTRCIQFGADPEMCDGNRGWFALVFLVIHMLFCSGFAWHTRAHAFLIDEDNKVNGTVWSEVKDEIEDPTSA